jgi:hypothetical protein
MMDCIVPGGVATDIDRRLPTGFSVSATAIEREVQELRRCTTSMPACRTAS